MDFAQYVPFNLCIEVLASQIRAGPDYKPIQIYETKHQLTPFADDMTLYLLRPEVILPPLLCLIEKFSCTCSSVYRSIFPYTTSRNWTPSSPHLSGTTRQ